MCIRDSLSDRSVRGMLIFDEYAESQSIKDTFSGADLSLIHI